MIRCYRVRKKNNNGSTMVETLVSFVAVAAVLAALYAIISFSTRLWMNSVDANQVQQSFSEEICRKTPNPNLVEKKTYKAGGTSEVSEQSEYADLALVLQTGSDTEFVISLNNISIDSYVSVDDSVKDENIVAPKVLAFKHKSQVEESGD